MVTSCWPASALSESSAKGPAAFLCSCCFLHPPPLCWPRRFCNSVTKLLRRGQGQRIFVCYCGAGFQAVLAKAVPCPDLHPVSHSCHQHPRVCVNHICATVVTYSRSGSHRTCAGIFTPVFKPTVRFTALVTASLGHITFIFTAG